jgi:hypothetical protein
MSKTFTVTQAFSTQPYTPISMKPVDSGQVAAIGYDAASRTLAVTFTRGTGAIYHYGELSPEVHAAFIGAESIGKYFGLHIKSLPFEKFEAPVAA